MAHSGNHSPAFLAIVMDAKQRIKETNVDELVGAMTGALELTR